jgi:hypothetical protein
MKLARSIFIAAALMGLAGTVYPQDFLSIPEDANFRESDRNGDGMLDADEWRAYTGEAA